MAAIDVPVLLVHGDSDRLVSVHNARDVAARNPGWRYLELPGVGHTPQLQVPEELAPVSETLEFHEPDLTLLGLRLVFEKNA